MSARHLRPPTRAFSSTTGPFGPDLAEQGDVHHIVRYNRMVFPTRPLARLARRSPAVAQWAGVELHVVETFATGALSRGPKATVLPTGVLLAFTAGPSGGRLVVDSCWPDLDGAHIYYAIRYVDVCPDLLQRLDAGPIPKDLARWQVDLPGKI